jgi:hypothetical protein
MDCDRMRLVVMGNRSEIRSEVLRRRRRQPGGTFLAIGPGPTEPAAVLPRPGRSNVG